jgi:hypothetical protein
MIAAIKPNVVTQHRVPISKSSLLLILNDAFLRNNGYLHEITLIVNTTMLFGQKCHKYSGFTLKSEIPP